MNFSISTIPGDLEFVNPPTEWSNEADGELRITAGEKTDWFFHPAGTSKTDNAPAALFAATDENFTLSAQVTVEFESTFDAGVLQVRVAEDVWGKLCFEYSPQGQPMVVSVVTRGVSDDCNSVPIESYNVYLRVARIGPTFAFHYSLDGVYWQFVRYFSLGEVKGLRAGFAAQSPTGNGCAARFSEIVYQVKTLGDLRGGE